MSADLGGRVGWLPKAESVKTLFLSPLQPQNAGVGGGGGRGGIPASFPSRSPPPKQPFKPTPTPCQALTRRFAKNRGEKVQAPGGPGPKPWGPGPQAPWRPGPQAPGVWIPPLSLVDFLQADLEGRWMVCEVPVFAPAFQPLGRAPSPWGPGQQAPEPCIPAA